MITNSVRQSLSGKAWELLAPGRKAIPATVPGNVHTDLMAAGLLADPHLQINEADMGWVEKLDWTYRLRFKPDPRILSSGRALLIADGLDTFATLWLNGRLLGRSQNSFVEHSWELGSRLKPGLNELLIRFDSPSKTLGKLVRRYGPVPAVGDPARVYARKAQYSFGWDWGPRLPTSGIFKDLRIEAVEDRRISDLWLDLRSVSKGEARGFIEAEVESRQAGPCILEAGLGQFSGRLKARLKRGTNRLRLPFRLKQPRLWWPHGHGAPNLYALVAALDSGESATTAVGIKSVELLREKDKEGESFVLKVNGKKIFCKGADWIPADTFMGRVTEGRIRRLVDSARDANMNMLRVWGGGFYESEEFYRACDEKGILVWQDFPFACNEVPELPWFVKEVKAEAEKAVRRLRRHASLAFWCGSNENHQARHDRWYQDRHVKKWGLLFYHEVLPEICGRLNPQVPYWPGSPFGGKNPNDPARGDRHNWAVWANFADYSHYREDKGRFLSEFGFAALPNRGVLEKSIPPAERFVQSRTMEAHDKVGGAGAYARIAFFIHQNLPESPDFDDFRYLSQVNQAEALVCGIEHWRRRQFNTSGTLFWQLNDCWPVTCWSVLDSEDTPKLAWHALKRAYDPLLLSAVEDRGPYRHDRSGWLPVRAKDEQGDCQAWITHDFDAPLKGSLDVELWNSRGRRRLIARRRVLVPANASRLAWSAKRSSLGLKDPAGEYLVFAFKAPGFIRRANLYFERPRRQALANPGLSLKAKGGGEVVFIEAGAKRLARYVELSASVPGRFSDNAFDLLPGEKRTIAFFPGPGASKPRFTAKTLNSIALKA